VLIYSSLSLGKDGIHALTTWRSDLNRALENKAGQYAALTNIVDESRRNTVYGGETTTDNYLKVVSEEDEASRPVSPISPGYTTGFPDSLDVPESINPNRNSLATLISVLDQELKMPPSAASEVTLFEFDPSADGVAESTPHESKTQVRRHSRNSEVAPPIPPLPSKTSRRSSIVYIKSDENSAPPSSVSDVASTGRVSPVIVRPLAPKPKGTKLRLRKASDQENAAPASSPKGLRPLSLLQDRDQNRGSVIDSAPATKPLSLGKANGKQKASKADRENVQRESSLKRALRPLKLVRSETTKQRAILREQEVLPDVVVRPPSDGQHIGFSYNFR
jgi:hypothetical protein